MNTGRLLSPGLANTPNLVYFTPKLVSQSLRLQKFSLTNREPLQLQRVNYDQSLLETAIMDLSFPGQRTATATLCIPHDTVCMPGPRTGKSENGFFCFDTRFQIFQNDSKICEAEVPLTPLVNKICNSCKSPNL